MSIKKPLTCEQQTAKAITNMPYKELRGMAKTLAEKLGLIDGQHAEVADALVEWADSIEVPVDDGVVYRGAEPSVDDQIAELDEDGSVKRKVEGTPDPEIPGGTVSGPGQPRSDLPKAKSPKSKEVPIDPKWDMAEDGSVEEKK